MPLCPQITNTPITVSLTGDFTVTSVLPTGKNKTYYQTTAPTGGMLEGDLWVDTDDKNKMYRYTSGAWVSVQDGTIADAADAAAAASASATAAAAAAATAQADAVIALAEATLAYNEAIGSLQPSADTIVNASNQITAINGTGITIYSGSSASSGARVVLNSLGLAAYGPGSSVNVTGASGNGTTVTYTASGHSFAVGRNITVSGLAPNGYNGSFVITAVVAGSTFTVANTTTGGLTDSNGVAEGASLAISSTTGNAVFSGSVTGSSIIGGTLNIAGNAIIDSAGLLTATGATIQGTINAGAGYFGSLSNGWSINSTGLVGVGTGTIVTSTGVNAIVLSSTDNAIGIKSGGSYAGWIGSIGSGAILIHYGTSPSSVAYPRAAMSSTAATLSGTASSGYSANTDGSNTIAGTTRFFNSIQVDQSITAGSAGSLFEFLSSSGNVRVSQTYAQAVSGRAMQISSAGLYGTTASTRRKKHDISSYTIDSAALLNLDVKTFKYIPEIDAAQDVQYGFIAEEAQELGLDELIQYDSTGVPDYFAYEKLPIFLLQLIKELKAEIDKLKGE
jgi:hypothetical protein